MELKIKKMRDDAIIPTRGSIEAAGIDLYACLDEECEGIYDSCIIIKPGETVMFGSGIACDFPEGYWGMVVPRSSIGWKKNLTIPQCMGVIDNDYKGEIKIVFTNIGKETQIISSGDRVAQMILLPYATYNIVETDTLSETERGEGGFGSTGK